MKWIAIIFLAAVILFFVERKDIPVERKQEKESEGKEE
jgi:hypothetical protein